jgi:hypothetical protein
MSGPYPTFPTNPSIDDTYTDDNGGVWTYGNNGWYKTTIQLNYDYPIVPPPDDASSAIEVVCRNNSNTITIPKGTAVRFAGSVGNSGLLKVAPMVANGSLPGYVFFGVTAEPILGSRNGRVVTFGEIKGINTSIYDDGDVLWCSPTTPGGFTTTEPQAPNLKLAVAAVVSARNNGQIFVRWDTGSRLMDLHDVEANGTKQDGDTLVWVAANNRWEAQ